MQVASEKRSKLEKSNVEEIFELSMIQKGMLFHHLKGAQDNLYNAQLSLSINGNLDANLIKESFKAVQRKNETLRSIFNWEKANKPLQIVLKECPFDFFYHDLSGTNDSEINERIENYAQSDREKRFDLGQLPIRLRLLKVTKLDYVFNVTHHHILYDGWSSSLMIKEIFEAYERLAREEYSGFNQKPNFKTVWRELLNISDPVQSDTFWKDYVKGYEITSLFSTSNAHLENDTKVQKYSASVPGSGLKRFAIEQKVTQASVVYAAFGILLSKYIQKSDIVFGTTVSGRNPRINGIDQVIGNFINTVPLRVSKLSDKTLSEVVIGVNKDLIDRDAHVDTSYYEIKQLLGLQPEESLFDAILVVENYPVEDSLFGDQNNVKVKFKSNYENSDIPLVVNVFFKGKLEIDIIYKRCNVSDSFVEELAHYFINILCQISSTPTMKVRELTLLTEQELKHYLYGFNDTNVNDYADETILTLFDRQAARTPHHPAYSFDNECVDYKTLQKLSDKIAHYLIDSVGIKPKGLVGVMLNREKYLIPAILGILKTGAAYLPVDPEYPIARKSDIIQDADLQTLITRSELMTGLQAGPVNPVNLSELIKEIEDWPDVRTEAQINKNDLAYVIYTSGSTGSPKGVMVAHRSLANYVTWAAEKYIQGENGNMPLYTSISFDLTITSIFLPLISGNKVILYPENDKGLLIEKVMEDADIDLIKLTPSHLKVIRGHSSTLMRTTKIKTLIVGGEELETELAKSIYQIFKGDVEIFNEYGPTEATVGCMVHRFDPKQYSLSVPIGVPANNTQVYLLDNCLQPVAKGFIGELYLSGDGIAQGYLFNEALTHEKFVDNPFVEGTRMYKTGDLAVRDSTDLLIFKGRRDDQVKVNGHRIELGEIQERIKSYHSFANGKSTSHSNGASAFVTVKENGEDVKAIVAYYSASTNIDKKALREHLLADLPDYMIPQYFVQLKEFPLTSNGKIDKTALPAPEADKSIVFELPRTEKEKLLAAIWSEVLAVKNVSITDNFFSLGGDSIKSIQISSRMRNAGYDLSVNDVLSIQTIKELAKKVQKTTFQSDQSSVSGDVVLSPIQKWFFTEAQRDHHHFNQSVLLSFHGEVPEQHVRIIFKKILEHHDALRMVFNESNGQIVQINQSADAIEVALSVHDLRTAVRPFEELRSISNLIQNSINLEHGPMLKLGLFYFNGETRLLIVIHHLVVDSVSWRILFEDIDTLYQQTMEDKTMSLPLKTDSFQRWATYLQQYVGNEAFEKGVPYWKAILDQKSERIERDYPDGDNLMGDMEKVSIYLDRSSTERLLTGIHQAFGTQVNDILLTALVQSIYRRYGHSSTKINLETHGRDNMFPGININRTIGWFTSMYPVILEKKGKDLGEIIKHVKEALRQVPNYGMDFLLSRYLKDGYSSNPEVYAQISFNYLGQFDTDIAGKSFTLSNEDRGEEISTNISKYSDWDITGSVVDGALKMNLLYSRKQFRKSSIDAFMDDFKDSLQSIISYCLNIAKREFTPSDMSFKGLSIAQLNSIQEEYDLEDIYRLSPMQEAMLFHSLFNIDSDHYFSQITYRFTGNLDINAVEKSMNDLTARYDVLRTVFLHQGYDEPIQLVLKERKIDFVYEDIRERCKGEDKGHIIGLYQRQDRASKFNLSKDVLMRLSVLQTADDEYEFIWSHHHILMDGWSMAIIIKDYLDLYENNEKHIELLLPPTKPYGRYIEWLDTVNNTETIEYWTQYLTNYDHISTLPKATISKSDSSSYRLKIHELVLDEDDTRRLQEGSSGSGITLNTLFQMSWGILLSKYSNKSDVIFGSVVSGRPVELEGIEQMVGLFINTIPVRIRYEEDSDITQLLQESQKKALEAEPYSRYPLRSIQSLTKLGKDLFDHIIVFENYPMSAYLERDNDYTISNIQVFDQVNYDLMLVAIPEREFKIRFNYNANVYNDDLILQISGHLKEILRLITPKNEQ
ncbi:MAG: amino acid adenylation domain-containing protein [Bacteroidota bacterium]